MNDKQREYTVKEIERHRECVDKINRSWKNGIIMALSLILVYNSKKIGYYNDYLASVWGGIVLMIGLIL